MDGFSPANKSTHAFHTTSVDPLAGSSVGIASTTATTSVTVPQYMSDGMLGRVFGYIDSFFGLFRLH